MSRLANALQQDSFVVTSELTPPKGTDLTDLFAKATLLKDLITAFNVTESHAARMTMDPVSVGHLLLDRGIEPIVQMTSRDKNRIAIQASMLGASALGIENLVFMGGDPPTGGDHPEAKPVFDLFASQLLETVHILNAGKDLMGNNLNGSTNFFVGAVVNPGAPDTKIEIDNAKRKIDAGAEFLQTQAIYDAKAFEEFMALANFNIPVLAGIIPVKSVKMAEYMNTKIPGIHIPDHLIEQIADAGEDKKRIEEIGVDISASTIRRLFNICQGVHVMAIGWEDKIPAILAAAKI